VAIWMLSCLLLRWRPVVALAGLSAAVALAVASRPAPPRDAELLMLDVGHGQAVILRSPDGPTVLVDAGSRTRGGIGRGVLLPALRELGVARIDVIVVTHADADHWNAVPLLLRRFPVGRLVTGPDPPEELLRAAREARVPWSLAHAGDTLLDGPRARLSVEAVGGDALSENDTSVVLVFESAGRRALLPADREERGLRGLLAAGLPRCEIVVAPHHGARCEEAFPFGRAVRPRLLLVSAARGFPDPATLERYGAKDVLATFEEGAIAVRLPAEGAIAAVPFRGSGRATIRAP